MPGHYGVRDKQYKLIYYYGKRRGMSGSFPPDSPPDWELYDLKKDPREMHNLYRDPAYRNVVDRLKTELNRLQKELGDTPA